VTEPCESEEADRVAIGACAGREGRLAPAPDPYQVAVGEADELRLEAARGEGYPAETARHRERDRGAAPSRGPEVGGAAVRVSAATGMDNRAPSIDLVLHWE
jgi:hypothetical protein